MAHTPTIAVDKSIRTYENALKLLEMRKRKGRPTTKTSKNVRQISEPNSVKTSTTRGVPSLLGMREWLKRLGHSDSDIKKLNVVHVAGTKGKGSTCAFVRSFLQVHGLRTGFPKNVGLYTSPDLRNIRERIQINDSPITEDLFTRYFYEVWERLDMSDSVSTVQGGRSPRFLQLMTLLAFHTFIKERTDATIVETHHGGEFDATNFVRQPVITAVTPIGMDHVAQLGPTVENIAWHKAGIFKPGALAYSASQDSHVKRILERRAAEKDVPLRFVEGKRCLPQNTQVLETRVQRQNCSLAVEITDGFLKKTSPVGCKLNIRDIAEGVDKFNWPGRFQVILENENTWYLDGAHNEMSVKEAAMWFSKASKIIGNNNSNTLRTPLILIFTHLSKQRDGLAVLKSLANAFVSCKFVVDHVVFTTFKDRDDGGHDNDKYLSQIATSLSDKILTAQIATSPDPAFEPVLKSYIEFWKEKYPGCTVVSKVSIDGAIRYARHVGKGTGMRTVMTGSLHLVGGALRILCPMK